MLKLPIYLDYNATTPLDPRVFKYMKPYFLEKFGNASSTHTFGFEAAAAVKLSREIIASLIGAKTDEIYFTSGATESINIVHYGIARAYSSKGRRIITSSVEHSASFDSLKNLEQNGFEVIFLPTDKNGIVDPEDLTKYINQETILVSIMTANNEIGSIQDIKTIRYICNEHNVLFHTDASQAVGKIDFNVNEIGADLVSFTSHKIYGPKGIGGLYIKNRSPKINIYPLLFGGGHEKNIRPGTLNVPAIAGFGKAAEICNSEMISESKRVKELSDRFYTGLRNELDEVLLNGPKENRLYNNLNIIFDGVKAETLISGLRNIAVSTGSACSSASLKPSRVLKAIGLSDDKAKSSIRISMGRFTTGEEIEYAVKKITEVVKQIRLASPSYKINKELTTDRKTG